jgi:cold-inducible RNA-binding protein
MNKKLYVGGLSRNTTEDALREAFAQAGGVAEVWMKIDRDTGMPAGFAFVTMETEAAAEAAITMWHGKELDGRTLVVNEARPPEARPQGGGFSPRGGGSGSGGGYGRDSRGGGGRSGGGGRGSY